ncbi:ABC transporter substrate-binding protein [Halosimplex sp. TS25]|uniref:ABC transporter substrate-binding protein n=1 Tax=Halosimplex rarum TaxID=3396619 RepID=UPI0039ECC158
MPNDGNSGAEGLSRRRLIKRLGAAGSAAAVAGCGSNGDGDGGAQTQPQDTALDVVTGTPTDTPGETTGETATDAQGGADEQTPYPKVDTTYRHGWAPDTSLPDANINMHAPNNSGELAWPVYARFGKPMVATGEWVHVDADGWEFDLDNNELRVTFKDGVKWHQGGEVIDDYLGKDYAMQSHFSRLMTKANPEASTASNPTFTGFDHDGGKTFIAHLNSGGVNKELIIENNFPRARMWSYRDQWRDRYEALKDASTQEKMNEIRTEVQQTTISLADDPPLSGNMMLEDVSTQQATFKRFPEHWSYDGLNWETCVFKNLSGSSGAEYQAAVTDNIDMKFTIPGTVDDPPEHIHQLFSQAGTGTSEGLLINYGGGVDSAFGFESSEPSADQTAGKSIAKARQGLAWAINGPQVANNRLGKYGGQFTSPLPKPVPGNENMFNEAFPEVWDSVPPMLKEADAAKAEESFRAAGLSKENGTWVKPNGEEVAVELESFPWSRDLIETIVTNLNAVDLNAEHIVQEQSVLFGNLGSGDYGMAQSWQGISGLLAANTPGFLTRTGSWETRYTPQEFEVPPVGEWDAEPTETVNPAELSANLSQTTFEEHKEQLRKLTWTWMYHVPAIPIVVIPSSLGWNDKRFRFPPHPSRSSGKNGRYAVPGDGSAAARIYGVAEPFRMMRRGLPWPNGPLARTE